MDVTDAIRITDDVVGIAQQIREEIVLARPRSELYHELFSLRRSVEELERHVRHTPADTLGDAC